MNEGLRLTGKQILFLRDSVVKAYPYLDELTELLRGKMEVQFDVIARGDTNKSKIFNLILEFEAQGRLEEFIRTIIKDRGNSPYLKEVKEKFWPVPEKISPYLTLQELRYKIDKFQKNTGRVSSYCFRIQNKASHLYVGVAEASRSEGTEIIQWTKNNDGSQHWYLSSENSENNNFLIINVKSNLYVGVSEASINSGQKVIQWDRENDGSQEWSFLRNAENEEYFQIQNKNSGKMLDLEDSSTERGKKLTQYEKTTKDSQLWFLEIIELPESL